MTALTRERTSRSVVVLAVFAVWAGAHLMSLATGPGWLELTTKALLMPSLAVWVLLRRGPRLVVAALLFSAMGDIALEFDDLFMVGMGFFAAAHACYVTFFLRSGAAARLRRRWYIPVAYAVMWVALVALLWSGLGELQIPVAAYSLLLTGTAVFSAGLGWRTGLGGALFFISDGLIALRLAEMPQPPTPSLWIMSTYICAQYLLASGTVRWSDRARES
jgi:uncharacterized membrane protein YhhN